MIDASQVASFAYAAFAALFLGALAALVYVAIYWRTIGSRLADTSSKIAVEVTQAAVAGGMVAATFAAVNDKPLWWKAAVAGVFCSGAMKLLQVLIDNRVKTAETNQKEDAADLKRQLDGASALIGVLHKAVGDKVRRLRKAIERRGKDHAKLQYVKAALTPRPHLDELLNALAAYFLAQLGEGEQQAKTFRVGVYVAKENVMTPVNGISSRDPGYNPFTSFRKHQANFRLDSINPSHVVLAVRNRSIIIVEDCVKAAGDGGFFFYNPEQRNYLRSVVCLDLGEMPVDCATMGVAALVVDTDVPGFFKTAETKQIQYALQEFAVRIKLELLLQVLVERRGLADERQGNSNSPGSRAGS